jgi:hypothetical protein
VKPFTPLRDHVARGIYATAPHVRATAGSGVGQLNWGTGRTENVPLPYKTYLAVDDSGFWNVQGDQFEPNKRFMHHVQLGEGPSDMNKEYGVAVLMSKTDIAGTSFTEAKRIARGVIVLAETYVTRNR